MQEFQGLLFLHCLFLHGIHSLLTFSLGRACLSTNRSLSDVIFNTELETPPCKGSIKTEEPPVINFLSANIF